jgi:hypothetical protein
MIDLTESLPKYLMNKQLSKLSGVEVNIKSIRFDPDLYANHTTE